MLKNLLISKTRIKLLQWFFKNPKEGNHVRGLVRELGEEINAVRRELLNLTSIEVLISTPQNNKVVYTINPNCVILNELRSLVYKNELISQRLYSIISDIGQTQVIILTERYMHNEYPNPTDVDLLFIGEIDIRKLSTFIKEIEKEIGKELRYSVISLKDYEFAKKKREPFIMNILQNEYVLLVGNEQLLAS